MPPSKSKNVMSDEERKLMIEKLNADLEDFVAERSIAARNKKATDPADNRTVDEIAEVDFIFILHFLKVIKTYV